MGSEKQLELENLNEDLRKLKSDLYQLEQFTEEQIRRTKNDIEKQNLSDSKNSESLQKKLKEEMRKVGVKHGKVLITNREEEDTLRQKLANIEVIQAYFRSYKVRKLLKGKGKKG